VSTFETHYSAMVVLQRARQQPEHGPITQQLSEGGSKAEPLLVSKTTNYQRWTRITVFSCIAIVLGFLFGFFDGSNNSQEMTETMTINQAIAQPKIIQQQQQQQQSEVVIHEATIPDALLLSAFEKCSSALKQLSPVRPKEEWKKPLWLPAFPGSGSTTVAKDGEGSGNIGVQLINGITGLKMGAKNYHALRKNVLKRCLSTTDETAACTNSHPLVPINPEKQRQNFHPNVILFIRNFKSAFPAGYNDKNIAYRGLEGQFKEEDWRKVRDEWIEKSFQDWKTVVLEWKQMDGYKIGMYVPYEKMLNPGTGPALTSRLAKQFQQAGFSVPPDQEMDCLWYQTVNDEWSRLKAFYKFIPGYTEQQRDFLIRELDAFRKEVVDDTELVDILNEYYIDVRDNTRIDRAAALN